MLARAAVSRSWKLPLCSRCYASTTSTSAAGPPMLRKLRSDMKAAMQAKDSNRLAVLRALLAQTINASKTSSPITTDVQLLALLRKNATASRAAIEEFRGAGRPDLVEKEEGQLHIIEEYSGSVVTVGEDEIRRAAIQVIEDLKGEQAKLHLGEVLKRLFAPEVLGSKPVEKAEVAKIVKQILPA